MSNMSYCRFQNTLPDLRDCFDHWDELDEEGVAAEVEQDPHGNKAHEVRSRAAILKLCKQIVDNYGDDEETR